LDKTIGPNDIATINPDDYEHTYITYSFCRKGSHGRELAHVNALQFTLNNDQFTYKHPLCTAGKEKSQCLEQLKATNGCLQGTISLPFGIPKQHVYAGTMELLDNDNVEIVHLQKV
jgi:hypothetical protein